MHAEEPIQEALGQRPAAAHAAVRILRREEAEPRALGHGLAELGDEERAAVVQDRVQRLEHGLRRQVQLVQQDPAPPSERAQQRPVAPREAVVGGQVRADQVLHVAVLAEVDALQLPAAAPRERADQRRLPDARGALQQHRALELARADDPS